MPSRFLIWLHYCTRSRWLRHTEVVCTVLRMRCAWSFSRTWTMRSSRIRRIKDSLLRVLEINLAHNHFDRQLAMPNTWADFRTQGDIPASSGHLQINWALASNCFSLMAGLNNILYALNCLSCLNIPRNKTTVAKQHHEEIELVLWL